MRILIRTSKWAILARRLGSVAVPLVVIPVVLHHMRIITSDMFFVAIIGAALVAAAAVFAGIVALCRLWFTGDQGWSRGLVGILLGGLCLIPFAWYGSLALRYPPVTDMATTTRDTMPLIFDPDMRNMAPPRMLSPAEMAARFPNVETRHYPLGQLQTFDLVRSLVARNGWTVRSVTEPGVDYEPGRINAQMVTIPGWREEIVVRVAGTADTSQVDMRAASINAPHDFGTNSQLIGDFLVALDDEVTTLLRDNPNVNEPVESDGEIDGSPDAAATAG